MKSFHGDKSIKQKYLTRVKNHILSDELVRGSGWDGKKGCAIGCTLNDYNHVAYETELGIPEWLARMEDILFENMTNKKSRTWPEKFLKAIPIGVDLNSIKSKFLVIVLKNTLKSLNSLKFDGKKFPTVLKNVELVKIHIKDIIETNFLGVDVPLVGIGVIPLEVRNSLLSVSKSYLLSAKASSVATESEILSASFARWAAWEAAEAAEWSMQFEAASSTLASARSASRSVRSGQLRASRAAFDYYADELIKLLKKAK